MCLLLHCSIEVVHAPDAAPRHRRREKVVVNVRRVAPTRTGVVLERLLFSSAPIVLTITTSSAQSAINAANGIAAAKSSSVARHLLESHVAITALDHSQPCSSPGRRAQSSRASMDGPALAHSTSGASATPSSPTTAAGAGAADTPPANSSSNWHNPYLGHRLLTPSQAHLLGEYHRLSTTLRRILSTSAQLSATRPHAQVLDELRETERKMGLVITLFKASVWSIVVEQDERMAERREMEVQQEEEARLREEEERRRGQEGEYTYEEDEDQTARY